MEELGDAAVLLVGLACHGPERGAADSGVLRSIRHALVVGHRHRHVLELRVAADVAERARGAHVDRAFARVEGGVGKIAAALVDEGAFLGHAGQIFKMALMERRVDHEARARAAEAVVQRGVLDVVPGGEALELGPAHPGSGHRAGFARGLEGLGGLFNLRPGARELVRLGRQACVLELGEIEVENGGGGVERIAEHPAVGRGIVAVDGRDVVLGIEFVACLVEKLADRNNGTLAEHHGCRADFKHLKNVRGASCAVGCDARRHRLVVGALVRGREMTLRGLGVEVLGHVGNPVAERIGHRMPHRDFSGSGGGRARGHKGSRHHAGSDKLFAHAVLL